MRQGHIGKMISGRMIEKEAPPWLPRSLMEVFLRKGLVGLIQPSFKCLRFRIPAPKNACQTQRPFRSYGAAWLQS